MTIFQNSFYFCMPPRKLVWTIEQPFSGTDFALVLHVRTDPRVNWTWSFPKYRTDWLRRQDAMAISMIKINCQLIIDEKEQETRNCSYQSLYSTCCIFNFLRFKSRRGTRYGFFLFGLYCLVAAYLQVVEGVSISTIKAPKIHKGNSVGRCPLLETWWRY